MKKECLAILMLQIREGAWICLFKHIKTVYMSEWQQKRMQLSLVSDWEDKNLYFTENWSHLNISHYIVVLLSHYKLFLKMKKTLIRHSRV